MVKNYNQLTLPLIFDECDNAFKNNKPKFLELLSMHIDLSAYIPFCFYRRYNRLLGRNRKYALDSMLAALILQKILGIPTVSLLITFLTLCQEAKKYCGFTDVPDNSQFTRFKQFFASDIEALFNLLVDITEPICHRINDELASTIAYDTSGIEAYVTENNPKFLNAIIKKLKSEHKREPKFNPYLKAYSLMPSCAAANDKIKQLYINGYFCYVYKFAIITNGLGIVRNITFLDDSFKSKHLEIKIDKKSDSPDEDKSISDSRSLKPVLGDYFKLHPHSVYHTFLGDSIFDTYAAYPMLMQDFGFKKVLIPTNTRNRNQNIPDLDYDKNGWPLCHKDPSRTMRPGGWCKGKGRSPRFKWYCPEARFIRGKWLTSCSSPCNGKPCGRMAYTSPAMDLRMYPGVVRHSDEWNSLYKIRGIVEHNIQYFKEPMACGYPKTRDNLTIKSDLYLAGITQLLTVILADSIHQWRYLRSARPLIS